MKKIFLTIAVFTALVIIGCQENSITNPVQGDEIQKNVDPLVQHGTIKLEGLLVDPSAPLNNYLTVSGYIKFDISVVYSDAAPPATQEYVSLHLSINAEIIDPDSPSDAVSTIFSESDDLVALSNNIAQDSPTYIDKYYTIQGKYNGLRLVCRFDVKSDALNLNSMWLEQVDSNSDDHQMNQASLPGDYDTYPPVVRNLDHTN